MRQRDRRLKMRTRGQCMHQVQLSIQRAALLSFLSGYFNNLVQFHFPPSCLIWGWFPNSIPLFACIFPNLRPLLPSQGFPSPLLERGPAPHVGRPREAHCQPMRAHLTQCHPWLRIPLEHGEVGAQHQGKGSGGRKTEVSACNQDPLQQGP